MSDNSTEHLESAQAYAKYIVDKLDQAKARHWSSGTALASSTACVRALREAMRDLESLRVHLINAAFELDGTDLDDP